MSAAQEDAKRLHGQFFTTTNPFNVDPFHKWLKAIPERESRNRPVWAVLTQSC